MREMYSSIHKNIQIYKILRSQRPPTLPNGFVSMSILNTTEYKHRIPSLVTVNDILQLGTVLIMKRLKNTVVHRRGGGFVMLLAAVVLTENCAQTCTKLDG